MRKKQQRQKLKAAPFPSHWSSILDDHFPLYARLPDEDRKELQGHIQVFLAEKRFEGCGGLEITEEMKVCIAAQACLLLLHRETDCYPSLRSILVGQQTRQNSLPLQRNHFLSVRATPNSGTLRCTRN